MPTEEILKGKKFEIRSWVENDSNVILDFLDELADNGDNDGARLYALIKRTADNGVTHNKKHFNTLSDGIFEFKAPNTSRIAFFYDENRLIICSHGFTGKKGNADKFIKKQIKKAIGIKEEYFREKGK